MKTNYSHSKKISVRFVVFLIFLFLTGLMLASFIIFSFEQKKTKKQFSEYMSLSTNVSNVSVEIEKASYSLQRYFQTNEDVYFDDYNIHKTEVYNLLLQIQEVINYGENAIYIRILFNNYEYCEDAVNKIISQEMTSPTVFNDMSKTISQYSYFSKNAISLTESYMNSINKDYNKMLVKANIKAKNRNLIIIIVSCISFFAVGILLHKILQVINNLSTKAQLLSNHEWDISDIKNSHYYELDFLASAFNEMKKNISVYIEDLNKKAEIEKNLKEITLKMTLKDKLLKEKRLENLQNQLDPHFLFNALNTIYRMAMLEGADQIKRGISAIADILRYSLTNQHLTVPLTGEIKILESYIYIQKARFQERMNFKSIIKGDITDVSVPPLILQSIVENAIVNGLKNVVKDGLIEVEIIRVDDSVTINVRDNGDGLSEKECNGLFDEIGKDKNFSGVSAQALVNAKKRLKLQYEEKCVLSVNSIKNEGTSVKITIPVRMTSRV